jgi:hypothetical protein
MRQEVDRTEDTIALTILTPKIDNKISNSCLQLPTVNTNFDDIDKGKSSVN